MVKTFDFSNSKIIFILLVDIIKLYIKFTIIYV